MPKYCHFMHQHLCAEALVASWVTPGNKTGFSIQAIPHNTNNLIKDSWCYRKVRQVLRPSNSGPFAYLDYTDLSFSSHIDDCILTLLKCLVYISTGNPDLRVEKNFIKYRSASSSTPVREHKNLSQVEFNRVGFNWLKTPIYSKNEWDVLPFIRFQPYGPGRSQYKWILVPGHRRGRQKPMGTNLEDEQQNL